MVCEFDLTVEHEYVGIDGTKHNDGFAYATFSSLHDELPWGEKLFNEFNSASINIVTRSSSREMCLDIFSDETIDWPIHFSVVAYVCLHGISYNLKFIAEPTECNRVALNELLAHCNSDIVIDELSPIAVKVDGINRKKLRGNKG